MLSCKHAAFFSSPHKKLPFRRYPPPNKQRKIMIKNTNTPKSLFVKLWCIFLLPATGCHSHKPFFTTLDPWLCVPVFQPVYLLFGFCSPPLIFLLISFRKFTFKLSQLQEKFNILKQSIFLFLHFCSTSITFVSFASILFNFLEKRQKFLYSSVIKAQFFSLEWKKDSYLCPLVPTAPLFY